MEDRKNDMVFANYIPNKESLRYKKDECLTGYIKNIESMLNMNNIPQDIHYIILSFYHLVLDKFKFDPQQSGSDVKFKKQNREISFHMIISKIVASNHIISSDICNIYSFEIELITKTNNIDCIIRMGFIQHPILSSILINNPFVASFTNNWEICINKNYAIFLYSGKIELIIGPEKQKIKGFNTSNYNVKKGDRFKLEINFIRANISLYYNNEFKGIIYKNITIDKKYVPAVELWNSSLRFVSCDWK